MQKFTVNFETANIKESEHRMGRMNLVMHIGTEKTGTTFLQNWLYLNQRNLSQNGIFLSDRLQKNNNRKLVAYFVKQLDDWCVRQKIMNHDQKGKYFEGFIEGFEEEIRQAEKNHRTMIITSEHFHSRLRKADELLNLKKFLEKNFQNVKIVCYFREQSQMATSAYSTTLRAASTETLEEYLKKVTPENYYYNFFKISTTWSNLFGKENCDFRIYDRTRFPEGDLRLDFLSRLEQSSILRALSLDQTAGNEALSRTEASLYRLINEIEPYFNSSGGGINPQNMRLKEAVSKAPAVKLGITETSLVSEIFDLFQKSNTQFFEEFFDGEFLFCRPNVGMKGVEMAEIEVGAFASDISTLVKKIMTIIKN